MPIVWTDAITAISEILLLLVVLDAHRDLFDAVLVQKVLKFTNFRREPVLLRRRSKVGNQCLFDDEAFVIDAGQIEHRIGGANVQAKPWVAGQRHRLEQVGEDEKIIVLVGHALKNSRQSRVRTIEYAPFEPRSFDGAFLCWVLEHVPSPARVLNEVRRVLSPGAPVYVTEVMNSSFLLDPYSPNVWRYWMAFNDFQYESGGDPFIGAKLGNLLLAGGFRDVTTQIKTFHFDNREPARRQAIVDYWEELLLSAADQLIAADKVTTAVVEDMRREMQQVRNDPNAVFFYAFVQARATAW